MIDLAKTVAEFDRARDALDAKFDQLKADLGVNDEAPVEQVDPWERCEYAYESDKLEQTVHAYLFGFRDIA